ncbi:hypothetical protein OUZ56_026514 [Daphnia magna]|uniref:Transmembrane protein n=1 Tax=Daphnia magna TaxID=35525 RepID=A0ABQ9ZM39_9CRUS|nr:hypothetical protein OUZ56_026514 [Daphnia magna]
MPCSLLGPLPAVLVLYQCPSPARRFQPVRCFRPARGSRPARRSTPARHFPHSVVLPTLSAEIGKKTVRPSRRQFKPFSEVVDDVRPLPVVLNLFFVSAVPVGFALPAVFLRLSFYPSCPRKFERKRQKKLREPCRTNGSTRTGTKGNNLLMVLEIN